MADEKIYFEDVEIAFYKGAYNRAVQSEFDET